MAHVAHDLRPVTLWFRKNEDGEWEFNHLQYGHVAPDTERPAPVHENHKTAWRKGQWRSRLAFLTHERPARVVAG